MKHPLFPSSLPIRTLAILACAAVSPMSVRAAATNVTWVGAGADTNWSTSGNWSSGGVTPFALPGDNSSAGDNYSLYFYSSASGAINSLVNSTGATGWYYRSLNFYSVTGGHDITLSGSDLYSSSSLGDITTNDNGGAAITIHIQNNIVSGKTNLTFAATKSAALDITGNVTLTAASGTLVLRNGNGFGTNTSNISGVIGGASGGSVTISKIQDSDWTLSNSNNRISGLIVGSGTLSSGANNALGATPNLVFGQINNTGNANSYVNLHGYNQTVSSLTVVTATAAGAMNFGHVINSNASTTSTFTYDNSTADQTYVGTIDQNINFVKAGSKNLTLTGSNTYTGSTTINGGTLTVNGSLAGSGVTVTAATLAGSGTASSTVSGSDATINGNGLKLGASTLKGASTLSGYNIATSVTVASGTTSLTGTTKSTSALTVSQGATLNANGTIDGSAVINGGLLKGSSTVTSNLTLTSGTLAPGTVHEITKVGGDFSMDAASKLVAEVSGLVAGVSYDQVQVDKNVSLAGTLDLSTLSGLTLGNKIVLIDNTGSGTTTGYFATIITNDSSYTTTSNSDYTFTVAGTEYLLSYTSSAEHDGYNNDVTLTVVPEPGTWAMLVGGIGMLAFGQRLRSRRS